MNEDSSAKYYKEKLQKKLAKDIKDILQKKKQKSDNMVMNNTTNYHNMKS